MKNTIILITFLIGSLFAIHAEAATAVVTGKLRYNRNWSFGDNESGSQITTSQRTGLFNVVDMQVLVESYPPLPYRATFAFTDGNGNFSASLPNISATGPYRVTVRYRGKDLTAASSDPEKSGYRITTGSGTNSSPVTELGQFTFPQTGGSIGQVTLTGTANRQTNAHQTIQWMVARLRSLGVTQASMYPLSFEGAVAALRGFTDTDPNSSCGYANTPWFCFNWDTLPVDNLTSWHEAGHVILDRMQFLFHGNPTSDFIAFSPPACPGPGNFGSGDQDPGRSLITETFANTVAMLSTFNPSNLPEELGPFAGFISGYPTAERTAGNCSSCEYPSNGSVPFPPACGSGSILRTEHRGLKMAIDLLDNVSSTGNGCLSENIQLTVDDLFFAFGTIPTGTGEGQLRETSATDGAYGNAVRTEDALSMLDILWRINEMSSGGYPSADLKKIWGNACWMYGETDAFPF